MSKGSGSVGNLCPNHIEYVGASDGSVQRETGFDLFLLLKRIQNLVMIFVLLSESRNKECHQKDVTKLSRSRSFHGKC